MVKLVLQPQTIPHVPKITCHCGTISFWELPLDDFSTVRVSCRASCAVTPEIRKTTPFTTRPENPPTAQQRSFTHRSRVVKPYPC